MLEPKSTIDAFGEERGADGKLIQPQAPLVQEVKTTSDGKPVVATSEKQPEPVDIEKHPVVTALKDQITEVKKSMGGNLSEQRKIIDRLEKDLKDARDGKKPSVEPLFKDVKRVRDLPLAEQEAMTDGERRLFDENADMKERLNAQHAEAQKERQEAQSTAQTEAEQADAKKEAAKVKADFDKKAQGVAKKLAGTDIELANKILENFNLFRDNEALDDEQLAERMDQAARMIPTYTPPKQNSATGGNAGTAVKNAGEGDPHGVDAIIQQAKGQNQGKYQL